MYFTPGKVFGFFWIRLQEQLEGIRKCGEIECGNLRHKKLRGRFWRPRGLFCDKAN
jgi:hypothetical protein